MDLDHPYLRVTCGDCDAVFMATNAARFEFDLSRSAPEHECLRAKVTQKQSAPEPRWLVAFIWALAAGFLIYDGVRALTGNLSVALDFGVAAGVALFAVVFNLLRKRPQHRYGGGQRGL